MPPATAPVPVLMLDALAAKLALIDGSANYYTAATFAGVGKDITDPQLTAYPATFIGEPSEAGNYQEVARDSRTLWHGTWYWDVPVFGVIHDVGGGDEAYRSLLKLMADIYRAVLTDPPIGLGLTDVLGWTMLGPQGSTDGRPWVAVHVRIVFRTRDNEMVTNPA